MASSECATLKQDNSQVWCKKMLDNSIAKTIGPVGCVPGRCIKITTCRFNSTVLFFDLFF